MKKLLLAAALFMMCAFGFANENEALFFGAGLDFQHAKVDMDKFNIDGNFNGFNLHVNGMWDAGNRLMTNFDLDFGLSDCAQYRYLDEDDFFRNLRFSIGEGLTVVNTSTLIVVPSVFFGIDWLDYQKNFINLSISTINAGVGFNTILSVSDKVFLNFFARGAYNLVSMVDFTNDYTNSSKRYNSYGKGYIVDGGLSVVFKAM